MSRFLQDFIAARLGTASFESSDPERFEEPATQDEVTSEIIEEVYEERVELADALEEVGEIGDDRNDIDAAANVAALVADAATAVDTAAPSAVEAMVGLANCALADAERMLDEELPRLDTNLYGEVTDVSMESLGQWFGTTVKAFGAAMSNFGMRVALGISRLSESSTGLVKRSMRVRGLMNKRKASGKSIKLSSGTARNLILGNAYATPAQLIPALTEFAAMNVSLTKVVETYQQRLVDLIKNRILDAVSNKTSLDGLINIACDDLIKQLDALIKAQPATFLGNQRYEFKENRYNKVLTVLPTSTNPDAKELVKHLDNPISLSNEELGAILLGVETIVGESLKTLERISTSTKSSFSALESVVSKLNNQTDSLDEVDLDDSVNKFELMRIETQLITELGRVVDRLVDYQRDLVSRLDAVIQYAEESVFQD